MLRTLLVLAVAGFAAAASAQQPAPAAGPTITVAPHTCKKPGEHPGRLASDLARRNWVRDANTYLECVKKYISDQQAIVAPLLAQAKPHLDAANLAVEDYNKAAAEFKAEQDKSN
jgi:hypothetical protein